DGDELAALTDVVQQVALRVDLLAQLVEISDFELGAVAHLALLRSQFPEDDLEQSALAGAVGSDDADAVAAHDHRREVGDHRSAGIDLADVLELRDDLAGGGSPV